MGKALKKKAAWGWGLGNRWLSVFEGGDPGLFHGITLSIFERGLGRCESNERKGGTAPEWKIGGGLPRKEEDRQKKGRRKEGEDETSES